MSKLLLQIIQEHKSGSGKGIFAVCSAHPAVLRASANFAAKREIPLLVESTSNQVNQEGGYTGMRPAEFARYLYEITDQAGVPRERVILGGDHLGPYPWRGMPAEEAMDKATRLAAECISAGYTKIHLDASMSCVGDPPTLDREVIARRAAEICSAAELCAAAERAAGSLPRGHEPVCYVIGTEVPLPGGIQGEEAGLQVTSPHEAEQTIQAFHEAFERQGLQSAWERVAAQVVQPGVEFGDSSVHAYDREAAASLSRLIETVPGMVYETHSTDYQAPHSLHELVEDHFAILKVGPALTFGFREAVFALANLEQEWLLGQPGVELSQLPEVMEQVMLEDDENWWRYYQGEDNQLRLSLRYSYSDRSRYYWNRQEVQNALDLLLKNITAQPVPPNLLSQFLPEQYARLQQGLLTPDPEAWIEDKVEAVLFPYAQACGYPLPDCR